MAPAGREVIVGVVRDLQFGHAVMFGMGGVLVEALGDVSFRIVPLAEKDAAEMVDEIRGSRLLHGYRGGKPADVGAIRRLLLQASDFSARHPEIEELDLNPVIVHEKGLRIVDARVIPAGGAG
jgi:acetyl-CoA synthetase (ADP-forming)